jgi:hypothetical protein
MRRTRFAILAVIAFALVLAVPALASAPRSGTVHVTKECSQFTAANPFCTVTTSNLQAIPVGSTVVYANAGNPDGSMDSDLVLYTRGANAAFGHVVLNAAGNGTITFSGGTGQFKKFEANIVVSYLGGPNFLWVGTYSY